MPDKEPFTSTEEVSSNRQVAERPVGTPVAPAGRRARYIGTSGDERFNKQQVIELAGLDPRAYLAEADLKAAADRLMATRQFDHASVEWLGGDGLHIWLEPLKPGERRLKSERVNVAELFQVLQIYGRHAIEHVFDRLTTAFRSFDEDELYVRGLDDGSRWIAERFAEIKAEYVQGRYFTHLQDTILYVRILKELEDEFAKAIRVSNFVFEGFVGDREQSDSSKPSLEERERQLVAFADRHSGKEVLAFVRYLFPESWEQRPSAHNQASSKTGGAVEDLPAQAPEAWVGGHGSPETPPEFIKRVYEPWLGKGLTKQHVRSLDPKLYTALYNWLGRGNDMPLDLDLPSLEEQNGRLVQEIKDAQATGSDHPALQILREGRRIQSLLQRHGAEKE